MKRSCGGEREEEESGGDGGVTSEGEGAVPEEKEEEEDEEEEEEEKLLDEEGSVKRSGRPLSQSWDEALGGYMMASNSNIGSNRKSNSNLCSNRKSSNKREMNGKSNAARGPQGPFYYIGGANGAKIVSSYCEEKGWQRIHDRHRQDYKFKWCETKSRDNYQHFREGQQLLYQIPNNTVLTTKIGLLNSLREYERVSNKVKPPGLRRLKMEQFFPDTFRLDVREEREAFFAQQNGVEDGEPGGRVWICKPTGMNQGKGIFLLKTPEDVARLRLRLQQQQERSQSDRRRAHVRPPQPHIAQRYVINPLLLEGRKFDVRSYLLIACTDPYMVFFRHGYARLTCDPYDPRSNNLTAHLTNQYMQKKNPQYGALKEDTVWSMEKLSAYVNDRYSVAKGLPRDWITGDFSRCMQQIMFQCFSAAKSKLDRKLGLFDLIGCDFLIDEDFKVWLLEMNCNPALHTNCGVLQDVVPSMLVEALDITLEIFSKRLCGQQILPLASRRDFVLLHSAAAPLTRASTPGGKRWASARVQPKSEAPQNAATATMAAAEKHEPTPRRGRSLVNTHRATTSVISRKVSEEVGKDRTSNSSRSPEPSPPCSPSGHVSAAVDLRHPTASEVKRPAPKRELAAAAGRTETLSRHVSALPPKSTRSRLEPRPKKCSRPPPEHFSPAKKLSHPPRNRASIATSLPTTRALVEGADREGAAPPERKEVCRHHRDITPLTAVPIPVL
ncbi:unnamed protein product [Merluccius merluccius]